jgi:quercetin dioxygenase-like cupin family protein
MTESVLTADEARARLIRRGDYVSCNLAFIDCKLPGSHLKQNYSMIGPGVTQSAEQVVNIKEPHGFNIGAAAMPNGITNNLHIHFTAEVFIVFRGEWLFRWGNDGRDGELVGRAGDVISMPTWIFRGFTNVGPDDGFVFTVLGGDDTGGIIWHPSILAGAAAHGLYLTRDNMLVDTSRGDPLPPPEQLLQPMPPAAMARLRRWTAAEIAARRVVAAAERQWSSEALLDSCLAGHASALAPVIGHGISQDRETSPKLVNPHGFAVEWLRLEPGNEAGPFRVDAKQVLIVHQGGVALTLNTGAAAVTVEVGPWDTYSVPAGVWRALRNAGDRAAEILVITAGDQRQRVRWTDEIREAARARGRAVDAGGYLAPAELLPPMRQAGA